METYRITRLGQQGDGIAEGPIFAPLTAPGELVTGDLQRDRLGNVKIVEPSDQRVKAPCAHFKACGGCSVQHIRDDVVADWKAGIVRDALGAQGIETEVRETITSPERTRQRAAFAARRTKKGTIAGFHGRASGTIVDVKDCHLLRPSLLKALEIPEPIALEGGSRKGELTLTVTDTRGGLDILVQGGKPLDVTLRGRLAQIAEAHKLARLTWEDEVVSLRTPPEVLFDGIAVTPPPGAFLQATEHGQSMLIAAVSEIIGAPRQLVDLFAGCGTFALPLAQNSEVLAVEGEDDMLQALDHGWRMAQGLKKVRTQTRDLFRNPLLPEDLAPFDAAVIDPPRAGAAAQIAALAKSNVPIVAHVSCSPQTFARDAKTLIEAGFSLDWVQPVDQFRWSAHVELVGAFRRA